ncbi:hypothetical protein pVco7_gp053 [Vibrio phage pVco-7]|uniref:Uncharacterized protein n=1 Tax=Vibrio phage pVco-5 TaxID=1965485 RepID=A0A1W6JUW1_9CAUD|nr:hypothetical protein KNT61_gp054 [Vibrio phage pVco-5]ARM71042.1 hypothetical protein pVco5_054 [Vibrio phage pVco-5]
MRLILTRCYDTHTLEDGEVSFIYHSILHWTWLDAPILANPTSHFVTAHLKSIVEGELLLSREM